jgi:hypothetical protein
MANIPSAASYMNDVEVRFEAALSEQLFTKYGANINYLLDSHSSQGSSITTLQGQMSTAQSDITNLSSSNVTLVLAGTNTYSSTTTIWNPTVTRRRSGMFMVGWHRRAGLGPSDFIAAGMTLQNIAGVSTFEISKSIGSDFLHRKTVTGASTEFFPSDNNFNGVWNLHDPGIALGATWAPYFRFVESSAGVLTFKDVVLFVAEF